MFVFCKKTTFAKARGSQTWSEGCRVAAMSAQGILADIYDGVQGERLL